VNFELGVKPVEFLKIRKQVILANSITGPYSDFSLFQGVDLADAALTGFDEVKGLLDYTY